MKKIFFILIFTLLLSSCSSDVESTKAKSEDLESTSTSELEFSKIIEENISETTSEKREMTGDASIDYLGTGHVFAGDVEITHDNLCEDCARKVSMGKVTTSDGKTFVVPGENNFLNDEVPFARDLYNPYGVFYEKPTVAAVSYENKDAIVLDEDGEVITAYIFANNYFELYINGKIIAKDIVPYTKYNSSIIKFKVKRPFNVAIKAIDWEEELAKGREANRGKKHSVTEGGIVFVFKSGLRDIIGVSDDTFKVQNYYTAPVEDLTKLREYGEVRDSSEISLEDISDSSSGYAVFWEEPENVFSPDFDDSKWANASVYMTEDLSVDDLPAYKNYKEVFDNSSFDARFIWTNNLYLDNEVIIRGTVK